MKVLELYSGIGGMHLALKASEVPGEVILSVDINTVANSVYAHNYPDTYLLNRNIQSLTPKIINSFGVDTILMSPPCQPFTRNGLRKDTADTRSCSFTHVIEILPELRVNKILIENVKGFEKSEMREQMVLGLKKAGFSYQEYILSPTQVGVPNTRHRYYCLAKKGVEDIGNGTIELELPKQSGPFKEPHEISTLLENSTNLQDYYIPMKILEKRAKILDICQTDSKRSCCFTKAYGRYVEGTGSVFTDKSKSDVDVVYKELENYSPDSEDYKACISKLNLRFFTPQEVSKLMSFPDSFSFPDNVSKKQQYMVLGNSINIKIVAELIKILYKL